MQRDSLCRAASSTIAVLPDNRIALPCFHHANAFVPIGESLRTSLHAEARLKAMAGQGTYGFCEGCHINCYFDPSYTASFSRLTLMSLAAKASYAFTKYVVYRRKFPRKLL